jgi:hypothetical protein
MDKFLEQLLPTGVARIPALVLVVLIYLYPRIRASWIEVRNRTSVLEQTKRQLELLKLCCEVEGLRKTHQLTDSKFAIPFHLLPLASPPARSEPQPLSRLPRLQAATFAALGCLASFALRIAIQVFLHRAVTDDFVGYGLAVSVVCLAAGALASIIKYRTRSYCFLIGFFFPWVLWGLVALFTNYAMQRTASSTGKLEITE